MTDGITQDRISVPVDSFTGFRLLYGDANTISQVSGTVLLGSIPILWYKEQSASIVKALSKKASSTIRRGVSDVIITKNKFGLAKTRDAESKKMAKALLDVISDSDDPLTDNADSDERVNEVAVVQEEHNDDEEDYNRPMLPSSKQIQPHRDSILRPRIQITDHDNGRQVDTSVHRIDTTALSLNQSFQTSSKSNESAQNASGPWIQSDDEGFEESIGTWPDKLTTTDITEGDLQQKVKFSEEIPKKSRSSSLMKNLAPNPVASLKVEPLDPKYQVAKERVKEAAKRTKALLKAEVRNRNRRRVFRRMNRLFEAGEIIKMEKMLVMVKKLEKDNRHLIEFSETEPCDTRIVERWKEYFVIARATDDMDNPVLIQFQNKRKMNNDIDTVQSSNRLDIHFNSECLVNFYNSLDKTISIVKDDKAFILRCQTVSSSVNWLTFLQQTLGKSVPKNMNVKIPGLNISLNVNLKEDLAKLMELEMPESLELIIKTRGYHRENLPIVQYLTEKIGSKFAWLGYEDIVREVKEGKIVLGFSWRNYDRLEWVLKEKFSNIVWQQCMNSTHLLELRKIEHYPMTVQGISEPTSIEGFLSRLTTVQGNKLHGPFKKQFFAFSYLFTSSHLLFYSYSHKGLPPLPYSENSFNYRFIECDRHSTFETLRDTVPQVYHHNPFEVDLDGHFQWLKKNITKDEFWKRDDFATYEFDRKLAMILRADGVIDLTDVVSIHKHDHTKFPIAVDTASNLVWNNSVEVDPEVSKDCYFEITMKNGTNLVLRAPNPLVKNEWITRLRLLKEYWALRVQEDIERLIRIKEANIRELRTDDYSEANVTDSKSTWENLRGTADSVVHNITPYSIYRPIIRCGFLYQKPKKHSSFKKYYVVLIPGFIILYRSYDRNFIGTAKRTFSHTHYMTIPITDCYIYSGIICENDLVESKGDFSAQITAQKSLPRVYNDGWLSSDYEPSRCFTLWFGTKRGISGRTKVSVDPGKNLDRLSQGESSKNPGLLKLVSRLGVTGRSMVFMCRSRQEKDLWVSGLYSQLERFSKSNIGN